MTNHKLQVAIFCLITLFCFCKQIPEKSRDQNDSDDLIKSHADHTQKASDNGTALQNNHPKLPLVYGFYFAISGDFDGNGTKETLTEHFFSLSEKRETSKWCDSIDDYNLLIGLIVKKEAYSYVICDTSSIDTLHIASGGRSFGLAYLKNEGDLNGDGTDEVSYVVNFTDWSELNTWYIMTCKNGSWEKVYSFPIWDWQLPSLPHMQYIVSGKEIISARSGEAANTADDNNSFEGLVKKISSGTIQVVFRNENSEVDTMIVNLK
ncbi:MAG: hypothetical protein ACM31E_00870 [Fibrobacterota bacterium]|nr:hypothetical protein [Chitinispirillaceae bacterium]